MLEFNIPDFGFDNYLQFMAEEERHGEYSHNWKYFLDYISHSPKFERLSNFIKFAHSHKQEEMQAKNEK